jgi:dihydroorotate dehydrogenase (fumarate)
MELSTDYMGLALRNPLVASASPLSNTVDGVRRLADAGVGAVVLHSLFEEQLLREAAQNARLVDAGTESFAESLSYFPAAAEEEPGPRRYLSLLERAAAAVDVPVIASLNGVTPGGWATTPRRCRRPVLPRSSLTSTTFPATRTSPAETWSSGTSMS